MTTPDRLKAIRESQGWSQETLAQALGVSFVTVSRWENGHHEPHRIIIKEISRLEKQIERKERRSHGATSK